MIEKLVSSPEDVLELAGNWPLCFDFDLKPGSKVVVAGAYKGKLIDLLTDLYTCICYGYEPQVWAAMEATERLKKKGGYATIHPYGLGVDDVELPMGEFHTDACSFVRWGPGTREQGTGWTREATKELSKYFPGDAHIDLAVINMEGYEFVLLPYLIDTGWLDRIDRLAIQWHLDLNLWDSQDMDDLLAIMEERGHKVVRDERPDWTYSVRA